MCAAELFTQFTVTDDDLVFSMTAYYTHSAPRIPPHICCYVSGFVAYKLET